MTTTTNRGFTVTRRIAASPGRVFRAWTDPDELAWFGDPDADHPTTVDRRVGGAWRCYLVQPDGERYWTGGTYRDVVDGERIGFTWGTVDGWPGLDPAEPDANPVITVDLVAVDPTPITELTLRADFHERISDAEVRRWMDLGIEPGWTATIDRLGPHLAR